MSLLRLGVTAARVLRERGPSGVAEQAVRMATRRMALGERLDLRTEDVADSTTVTAPPLLPQPSDGRLTIGWVMSPPGPGSGGHTTVFRFIEALERAGHTCVIHLYETARRPVDAHAAVIRGWWPGVRAQIRSVDDGLTPAHALVATSWETAHVLATRPQAPGHRFYLVQDYEPWFYPRGSVAALAEDSYHFRFSMFTVGGLVADELQRRFGLPATVTEFGCDTDVYRWEHDDARDGVVFYSKPGTPRRGFELGVLALQRFQQLRPDVPIHTFGVSAKALPFRAEVHGRMSPAELNTLYQRCAAGLSLSFTNVSLIPYELLASGVLPVVNDWYGTRDHVSNPHVQWARPTPGGLADALAAACDLRAEVSGHEVSASLGTASWRSAEDTLVTTIAAACIPDGAPPALRLVEETTP